MKSKYNLLFLFFFLAKTFAQAPQKPAATEVYEQIQKLNFLGKVLYVAAHPDDENTRLITYLSNHYHANTAYLSLTRGDGGQNLIGPELKEKLGAIRTQELLAARKIDGGTQFFTRANDFGYSKEPNETFAIWNKKEVLDDVMQVIENFQPDIVINRFNHRTPGTTHGHHTASAILSLEAYENVKFQPKRIFFNTSWWFYGSEENFNKADKSKLLTFNANVYYPLKGKSNHEIAALSRSQHKCQGFGTMGSRGEDLEYLEILKGTLPPKDNLFEGIETSWKRVKGGENIAKILLPIEKNFNFQNPSIHIPELIKAYKLIQNLEDNHWKSIKSNEIKSIIEICLGLFLEGIASTEMATRNSEIEINLEAVNRSGINVKLESISLLNQDKFAVNQLLKNNEKFSKTVPFVIKNNMPYSNLYWLNEKQQDGLYTVSDKNLRNLPEVALPFPITFELSIENESFTFTKNLVFKKNEPDFGETYSPFVVAPKFSLQFLNKVAIFNANQTKEIQVKVTAFENNAKGILQLNLPNSWQVFPKEIPVSIGTKGETKMFTFSVTSSKNEENLQILAQIQSENVIFNQEVTQIKYNHIPTQTLLEASEAKFVNLNIKTKGKNIGYVMGAGDEVGKYLENLSYKITYLEAKDLESNSIQQFDAIILGIRAFNVVNELKFKNKILFDYVKNGGNVIVQYNTTNNLVTKEIAPFELKLSRDRVTEEDAPVTFLSPKHPVLNQPNRITNQDFNGWIQERGLYFPNEWSNEFIPILAMNDKGESPSNGSLLVAKHGKGNYIYTGLSFFRELPEGVSGAYKLLANLIALE
jgi:hypothetical protein